MFKDLKNWPDDKKKKFSIITAIIITLIIAFGWFFIKSNVSYFNQENHSDKRFLRDFKESFEEITNKFNETKDQIFGTSTGEIISTSSTSTE